MATFENIFPTFLAKCAELHDLLLTVAFALFVVRSEEHTSELQSHSELVCRLLLEKKNNRTLTDGANVAQPLGKAHIRPKLAKARLLDRVDRAMLAQRAAHPFVPLSALVAAVVQRT